MTIRTFDERYRPYPIAFTAGADHRRRAAWRSPPAERAGSGSATVSLMPADNVEGFRPDTLALLRELNAPVYRWPGGNFVSGYDWRDGIGDRDRRPPRKNPAWKGVEHNDVGIHEFMALCRLISTEPYIAVNSGLGDAASAAAEVEYANGAADNAHGRAAGAERQPGAVQGALVVHRQRDVRQLAARAHAAGRLREEAHRVRRGDAREGSGASS